MLQTVLVIMTFLALAGGVVGAVTSFEQSGTIAAYSLASGIVSSIGFAWMGAVLEKLTSISTALVGSNSPEEARTKSVASESDLKKPWDTFSQEREPQD